MGGFVDTQEGGGGGRRHILAVARELFMSRGYRAVSTREIATVVGITQPALYHHFGGKEELYIAVLEDELRTRSQAMWEAARLDLPPRQRFEAIASVTAERSEHDLSQMFHDLRFEISEGNRQRIRGVFREAMLQPMLTVIEDMEREGAMAPARNLGLSHREVAMLVLSTVRVLTKSGWGPDDSWRTPDHVSEIAVRLVVNGIGAGNAE